MSYKWAVAVTSTTTFMIHYKLKLSGVVAKVAGAASGWKAKLTRSSVKFRIILSNRATSPSQ